MRQLAYRLLDEALALMAHNLPDEALSKFDAALSAAAQSGNAQALAIVARNAGLAYEQCQRLSEAVRCFEISVANDPSDGRSFLTLATLERQLGDLGASQAHVDRALQIAADTHDEELRGFINRSGLQ